MEFHAKKIRASVFTEARTRLRVSPLELVTGLEPATMGLYIEGTDSFPLSILRRFLSDLVQIPHEFIIYLDLLISLAVNVFLVMN